MTNITPQEIIEEASRREFEAKFNNYFLGKFEATGDYINSETAGAWKGWQAARQSSQSEPVAWAWKARQPNGQILQRVEMWNPISAHVPSDSYTVFDIQPLYAAPQQAIPSGWRLVPIEPTDEMLIAGRKAPLPAVMLDSLTAQTNLIHRTVYKAMITASPTAPIERDK